MAKTRAEITTAINGFLTALVTIVKHKSVVNEILDALWPTQLTMSATPATGLQYRLDFKRQGNMVHVSGYINNKTGGIFNTGTLILTVTDAKYHSRSGTTCFIMGKSDVDSRVIHIDSTGKLSVIVGNFRNNEYLYFSGSYLTND